MECHVRVLNTAQLSFCYNFPFGEKQQKQVPQKENLWMPMILDFICNLAAQKP